MFKIINLLAPLSTVVVVYGSLTTNPPIHIIQTDHADKWYHATAYFILFFAWYIYFQNRYLGAQQIDLKYHIRDLLRWECSIAIGAGVLCMAIGGILELVQGYLATNRSMDILDMLANTVGILFAAGSLKLISFCILTREKK